MSDAKISLRGAREEDAYALWLWANDEQTRRASFGRPSIPWSEHWRWLHGVLHGEDTILLVAEIPESRPVGSVRFNTADGWCSVRLSYVLAPEARGLGLSRGVVEGGVDHLRARHPNAHVWAEVLSDNEPSLRVFRGSAWMEEHTSFGSRFSLSTLGTVR